MSGLEKPEQCNAKAESPCPFDAGDILGISGAGKGAGAGAAASEKAAASQIADLAKSSVGQELWQGSGLPGYLGGAAAVSRILQEAGKLDHNELSVNGLAATLSDPKNGWERFPLDQRQPGDVIIVNGGTRIRNAGIVDSDGRIMSNRSSSGTWGEMSRGYLESAAKANAEEYALRPKDKE